MAGLFKNLFPYMLVVFLFNFAMPARTIGAPHPEIFISATTLQKILTEKKTDRRLVVAEVNR